MQVAVEIPDDIAEAIGQGLRPGAPPADVEATIQQLAQVAANEFTGWLTGERRYRSLTELQIEWVGSVFERVLANELPTRQRLYNDFNISYGQASYIARVLADRDLSQWRTAARAELYERLAEEEAEARDLHQQGHGATTRVVKISDFALRELERDFTLVAEAAPDLNPPRVTNRVANSRYVDLEAATIVALIDAGPAQ